MFPTVNDPCDPNPCGHGGLCQADGDQFTCICPKKYTGTLCESEIGKLVQHFYS